MHIAEEETLEDAPSPDYFKEETRFNYFKRTAFNFKEWKKLKKICNFYKVEFLCSPFSEKKAVDILEKIKVDSYKVPSGELTNLPLLERLKKTKKHIYLSTGMSNWKEITIAIKLLKNYTLLQCSSIYPCPLENVGINVLLENEKKI